jgi:hypothetical protein
MALKLNDLDIRTNLPVLPPSLPVFALEVPTLDERRASIGRLGERMKLGALRTVELEHGVVMASKQGDITFFRASGAVWARDAMATKGATDELRKWDGLVETTTDGQRMALNPDASKKLLAQTRELLEPLELIGKEVASEAVQLDQVAQLDAKGKEIAHGAGQATIKFQYAVGGVPVRGAGAKTLAFAEPVAGQPRFSGVFHAWRTIGKEAAVKLTTIEEALGVGVLTDPELGKYQAAGHRIQLTRLELVYLALPAFMRQSHLLPTFQMEGTVSEGPRGISFHFARFHHAVPPRIYAAADLYGPYLTVNPDGISPAAARPAFV